MLIMPKFYPDFLTENFTLLLKFFFYQTHLTYNVILILGVQHDDYTFIQFMK